MMIRFSKHQTWQVFLLLWLLVFPIAAQAPLIEVQASVDRSVITIGDRITYTLQINRDPQLRVADPGKGTNLGMFEIKDYTVHPPRLQEGRLIERFDYVIAVYDTGTFVIPPFPVAFLPTDTSTIHQIITSEPLEVRVESVLKADDPEIHDLKPLVGIPLDIWKIVAIGGGVLLLLLGGLVWWWYRRRTKGQSLFRKEVIRPAHELAGEELSALLAENLLEGGHHKEFYSRLSDIQRRYLERRFFLPAMEETTTEIVQSLRAEGIEEEQISLALQVLSDCDQVKFARYIPGKEESEDTVSLLREFIDRTRMEFAAVEHQLPAEAAEAIEDK